MRLTLALAAIATLYFGPAQALDCARGRHIGDAQVVPPANIGRVLRATQFAWDGGNRISHACDLTDSGRREFEGVWRLFSGEVNREFGGICVMLTGTNGRDHYSCATPGAVERARGSAEGSRAFRLHFDEWQPGLRANITE